MSLDLDLVQADPVAGFEALSPHVGQLSGQIVMSGLALVVLIAPSVEELVGLVERTAWSDHPDEVRFPQRWRTRGAPADASRTLERLLELEIEHGWTTCSALDAVDGRWAW